MKRKNKRKIFLLLIVGIISIVGASFALWQITLVQTEKNIITAGCFTIELQEENDIQLMNAYPISDEEGKKLTPYTFTITNTCESFASFQINLEILDSTTLENFNFMKVMLDDKISLLTSNPETTKTLNNATTSYKLESGYLRENQSKTFHLRLWMDIDTPPRDEFMNKIFKSKVTIISNYKDNLDNTILAEGTSLNEKYMSLETFSIHVTSEKYNLVSMSEDLESWEELENKGKDITVEKTVNTNGSYTYYFQDEAENVKEVTIEATKIDDKKPISNMSVTKTNNVINIDASSSIDNETSISKYYYSKDGENFIESSESNHTFTNEYTYGVATTMLTNYERNQIKKVYLKVEDEVGNRSEVKEISITDTDFAYDETSDNNLRYIGASPNNYVSFNNELWRIIGVMNNVDDGTGKKETRIKLIRNESIGEFSWDSSPSNINGGYGVNEWSQADVMKLLNPGYESESVGGSLYWNRGSGTCYNNGSNNTTLCDFTRNGLNENSKQMISSLIWHTGSNGTEKEWNDILPSKFYELERGNNTGKVCTIVNSGCNDTVERTTTWVGKVGLMYPSDYGFAVGGSNTNRSDCINMPIYNWKESDTCYQNNWLYSGTHRWTITPRGIATFAHEITGHFVFNVSDVGNINTPGNLRKGGVLPVVYLRPNIKIMSGLGILTNPFTLE